MQIELATGYRLDIPCGRPSRGLSVEQVESLCRDYWAGVPKFTHPLEEIKGKYRRLPQMIARKNCRLVWTHPCPTCGTSIEMAASTRSEFTKRRHHVPPCDACQQPAVSTTVSVLVLTEDDRALLRSMGIATN